MALGSLLLLSSALLHALWNAIAKASKDKETFLFLTILQSGVYTWILHASLGQEVAFSTAWAFKVALLSGVFEGLYFLTLSQALKTSHLGTSYAIMRGGAMVWVWIFSFFVLQEQPTVLQLCGVAGIFLGILVMNSKDLHLRSALKENGWALLSSVFIAGYHLCYHQALEQGTDPESVFTVAMLVSLPFLFFGIRKNTVSRLKATVKTQGLRVFATGIFAMASFLIFLYGLQKAAPGFAISLRNSSIFFALMFSWFLKESLTRAQWQGAILIGIGAFFLSL